MSSNDNRGNTTTSFTTTTTTTTTATDPSPAYPNRWVLITGLGQLACAGFLLILAISIEAIRYSSSGADFYYKLDNGVQWWGFIFILAGGVIAVASWKIPKYILRQIAAIASFVMVLFAIIFFIVACVAAENHRVQYKLLQRYVDKKISLPNGQIINLAGITGYSHLQGRFAIMVIISLLSVVELALVAVQAFFCGKWFFATRQMKTTHTVVT